MRNRTNPDNRSPDVLERRKMYRTKQWKQLRAEQLRLEPYCRLCRADGRSTPATIVDHVRGHNDRDWRRRFYDLNAVQSLCKVHHDRKTMRSDAPTAGFRRHQIMAKQPAPIRFGEGWNAALERRKIKDKNDS